LANDKGTTISINPKGYPGKPRLTCCAYPNELPELVIRAHYLSPEHVIVPLEPVVEPSLPLLAASRGEGPVAVVSGGSQR